MIKLNDIQHFYFIGIGGIGMSALARYFRAQGLDVSGYDKTGTQLTRELEAEGIQINYQDEIEQIPPAFLRKPEKAWWYIRRPFLKIINSFSF